MADFGLDVAPMDVVLECFWEPFFLLLFIREKIQRIVEHGSVDDEWCLTLMETVPSKIRTHDKIKVLLWVVVPAPLQLLHPV